MKIINIFSFCYTTVVKVTELSLNVIERDIREQQKINRLQRTDKRYIILRKNKKIAFLQTHFFVCLLHTILTINISYFAICVKQVGHYTDIYT